MKALRISCLVLGVVACIAFAGPAANAKIQEHGHQDEHGDQLSNERRLWNPLPRNDALRAAQTHDWKCPADNSGDIPVCHLNCNAHPPQKVEDCLFK